MFSCICQDVFHTAPNNSLLNFLSRPAPSCPRLSFFCVENNRMAAVPEDTNVLQKIPMCSRGYQCVFIFYCKSINLPQAPSTDCLLSRRNTSLIHESLSNRKKLENRINVFPPLSRCLFHTSNNNRWHFC